MAFRGKKKYLQQGDLLNIDVSAELNGFWEITEVLLS